MLEVIALMLLSQQPLQPVAEGVASYYTVQSSGRVTASGEAMNDDAFTCAMLEGDFGTNYLVVAENGKSVIVKLNDRGPFKKGRVIDLSEAAMRALDSRRGLLKVEVYELGSSDPIPLSNAP